MSGSHCQNAKDGLTHIQAGMSRERQAVQRRPSTPPVVSGFAGFALWIRPMRALGWPSAARTLV